MATKCYLVYQCQRCGGIEKHILINPESGCDWTYSAEKMYDEKTLKTAIEGGWIAPKKCNSCQDCCDSPAYNEVEA